MNGFKEAEKVLNYYSKIHTGPKKSLLSNLLCKFTKNFKLINVTEDWCLQDSVIIDQIQF
jgi:hypothetical protein